MLLSSRQLTAMSQHHTKNICRSLYLASIFAAVSKKGSWGNSIYRPDITLV